MNDLDSVSLKLLVSQYDESGRGFLSTLVVGKPSTIKLASYE